ncbi:hypothetical protein CI105_05740 [Candidatus Izimaplasma bacterium ZiA1]|uniref:type II secretion system protein n=1 Tax=Candidatus Izimoplasma sp. ZiA1 TaxID=2024899 RepID=UPI000BAA8B97|nr:hypothetical protein CI105_05740 [Candidatus Izimaplasma bacterium ZiA1]
MNQKGVTLIELLIVIVVMGIIAAFSIVALDDIITNTSEQVDEYNVKLLEDKIELAIADGTLTIRNNKLYNTVTKRSYAGTGSWFVEDMLNYLGSRVIPIVPEAKNIHNLDGGDGNYKFWFGVKTNKVEIFYYDISRTKVVLGEIAI